MPRKKYEQKNLENVNTLRLPVDFGKLYPISIVDEAYYILLSKGKKKSSYIMKAYDHYKSTDHINMAIHRALQRLRIAAKTKSMYNIDSEEEAIRLLSLSEDSETYQAILHSIPEYKKPAKMLCGFKIDDEKAIKTHAELYNMSANERVLAISNSVVNYVLDGFDPEMEQVFAIRFLLSSIREYQNSQDKRATLKHFLQTIK